MKIQHTFKEFGLDDIRWHSKNKIAIGSYIISTEEAMELIEGLLESTKTLQNCIKKDISTNFTRKQKELK